MRYIYGLIVAAFILGFSASTYAYTNTTLQPIKWKGEKWEYLVEHPTGKNHIDPALFEEILDTAGQHGWRLVSVTSAYHFYTFYFVRPLLPHKIEAHRARLQRNKNFRANKEAEQRHIIQTTVEKENARRVTEKQAAAMKQQEPAAKQEPAVKQAAAEKQPAQAQTQTNVPAKPQSLLTKLKAKFVG